MFINCSQQSCSCYKTYKNPPPPSLRCGSTKKYVHYWVFMLSLIQCLQENLSSSCWHLYILHIGILTIKEISFKGCKPWIASYWFLLMDSFTCVVTEICQRQTHEARCNTKFSINALSIHMLQQITHNNPWYEYITSNLVSCTSKNSCKKRINKDNNINTSYILWPLLISNC